MKVQMLIYTKPYCFLFGCRCSRCLSVSPLGCVDVELSCVCQSFSSIASERISSAISIISSVESKILPIKDETLGDEEPKG